MTYQAQIINAATSWEGVTTQPHRFGGIEFNMGKIEIGHIHGSYLLDVPFTVKLREALVADGEAQNHHILPESGWISFYLRQDANVEQAVKLLRLSYLHKRIRRVNQETRAKFEVEISALAVTNTLKSLVLSKATHDEAEA